MPPNGKPLTVNWMRTSFCTNVPERVLLKTEHKAGKNISGLEIGKMGHCSRGSPFFW